MSAFDTFSLVANLATIVSVWLAFHISKRDRRRARINEVAARFASLRLSETHPADQYGIETFLVAGALTLESQQEVFEAVGRISLYRTDMPPILGIASCLSNIVEVLHRAAASRADLTKQEAILEHIVAARSKVVSRERSRG